jgi:thiamine-monophosphate kinase
MKAIEEILENTIINAWERHFDRAPYQSNRCHEADAELIEIQGNETHLLAVTIDTVAEEISAGLYQDPFTMGWVTVMANLSDLAAVGAEPLGMIISVSVEPNRDQSFCGEIARGMAAACRRSGTFILGGDTNSAPMASLTGCAIGLVPRDTKITRIGCRAGDIIFLSGPAGPGSALGLARLLEVPGVDLPEGEYRPIARIPEGKLLRHYASCCMDTSDGVLATLDQLMRINEVGFMLDIPVEKMLHPAALELAQKTNLPPWMMLAGHHGEFELLFSVPESRVETFLTDAVSQRWTPIKIGKAVREFGIKLLQNNRFIAPDTGKIRNLIVNFQDNVEGYIQGLLEQSHNGRKQEGDYYEKA